MPDRGQFTLPRVCAAHFFRDSDAAVEEEGDDWFLAPAAAAALLSLSIPFHLYLLINYVGLERHRPRFMFLTTWVLESYHQGMM